VGTAVNNAGMAAARGLVQRGSLEALLAKLRAVLPAILAPEQVTGGQVMRG